jgi:hypothetical protein
MGNRRGSAGGRLSSRAIRMTVVTTIAGASGAAAQTSNTMSGPPVQVQPYAPEPGVPLITINPGTPNPFAGATDPVAGSGTDTGSANGGTVVAGAGLPSGGGGVGASGVVGPGPTTGAVSVSGSGTSLIYTNADGTTTTLSGGSMAWRDNNPGNLIYNSYTASLGAIGSNNGFAVFPDAATGTAALTSLLNGSTYQSLSVNAAIAKYAPPSENNTTAYQASVMVALGVSGSTPLSSFSQSQMQTLQSAIQQQEGYVSGTTTNS